MNLFLSNSGYLVTCDLKNGSTGFTWPCSVLWDFSPCLKWPTGYTVRATSWLLFCRFGKKYESLRHLKQRERSVIFLATFKVAEK